MHWHSLTPHLLTVLGYGYEVLGGVLIFYSSAVTETSLPEDRKRIGHWIMFGLIAVVYIAFGIGLRHAEMQQNEQNNQRSSEDRTELRNNRERMESRMDQVLSSFQVTYSQLASLSLEIGSVRLGLLQAIHKNDPKVITSLEQQAQVAQQQVDNLSRELLAVTMAPQIARQLRDWEQELGARQQELHNFEWEEEKQLGRQGKPISEEDRNREVLRIMSKWQIEYDKKDAEYQEKLKGIIATADFVRREMLQRIPLQRQGEEDKKQELAFAAGKSNPKSLSRPDAARYLDDLARRVPPPK
jgi:hypothetical protein